MVFYSLDIYRVKTSVFTLYTGEVFSSMVFWNIENKISNSKIFSWMRNGIFFWFSY